VTRISGDAGVAASVAAAPSGIATAVAERVRPDARLLGLLAVGHLVVDTIQGSVPALLPFLKTAFGLTYAAAGTIMLMATLTSSIIQPLFGYLSDQTTRRWILPLSILLAGLGIATIGLAPSYPVLLVLVVIMGLGVAAWHPEGYRTASSVAGDRQATGVSWFSLGGNVGIALGPPVITMLVTGFGLTGSVGLLVPAGLVALVLVGALPHLAAPAAARTAVAEAGPARNMPGAMALLIGVVMLRSWTQLGFTTFVPFYYIDHLKADPRIVGPLLFVFLGAGALGTIVAGPVADRFGARPFMVWACLLAAPMAVGFLLASGGLAFLLLGAVGFTLISTFTVSVVLAQAYLPRNLGMASGMVVGFAIGTGGLGVALLGWIADRWGLPAALWITAVMPLPGFGVALLLPEPRPR
jgi:FSR family fosmidomycin resistance protein-like MFS transporter